MNTTIEKITQLDASIKAIAEILLDMDPASGVTFCVRRGVADEDHRPWVTVETGELTLARPALELIQDAATRSKHYWVSVARKDRDELNEFLRDK